MEELGVPQRGEVRPVVGDAPARRCRSPCPRPTVHMAAMRGMEVVVLRPEGFALPAPIMEKARAAAAASGGSVRETARPRRRR
jgi:N-acetylornithine carbamoyltransferase